MTRFLKQITLNHPILNHTITMPAAKRIPALLLVGIFSFTSSLTHAAETGEMREAYVCNYINGADKDDLMKARDNLVKALDKLGIKQNTFLWEPMTGTSGDIDFLWFNTYDNLNAFGNVSDTYWGSTEGPAAQAKFDAIVECTSSLSSRQEILNRGTLGANPPVTISVSSCQLNHGHTMDGSVPDFVSHLQGTIGGMDEYENFMAYMMVPTLSQTDVDLRFVGVYNTTSDYAAAMTALQTTEAGQMLGRHFRTVFDCKSSLWSGERIITND
jgi:hypothetical protein